MSRRDRLLPEEARSDAIAVLALPCAVERFELADHVRGLLAIPRVLAMEPSRLPTPRALRDGLGLRQGRRLRFPGRLAALVLYDPAQYPLARGLKTRHRDTELWYVPPGRAELEGRPRAAEVLELDDLARHHAAQILERGADLTVDDAGLRERLRELEVISPYAFVPGRARTRG